MNDGPPYTMPPQTIPPQTLPNWHQQADEEKLRLFLARFPTANDVARFVDEHDKLVENEARRAWLVTSIRTVCLYMAAMAGAIAAYKVLVQAILGAKP